MSSLLDALNKSMRKNTPRTLLGRANLLGEVVEYGEKTVKVKVLNGPIVGQEIDIIPGKDPISKYSKPSKAQTSSYTPVGGILRFDNVEAIKDGPHKSSWVNAFIKTPNENNILVTDQLASFRDTGRNNKDGKPIMQLRTLDAAGETKVNSLDQMRDALAAAFASSRAALVLETSDGVLASQIFYLPGKKTDKAYVHEDPTAFAAKLIEEMGEEGRKLFSDALEKTGMTIVPMKTMNLGPTTSEEIKKALVKAEEAGKPARIMSVNPLAYEAPSMGDRLAATLLRTGDMAIPKEHQDRLQAAFLAGAAEDAKAAFHSGGWRKVSDTDLRDFFAAQGVELKKHPEQTWNSAAIHMQKYDGGPDFFVAKTYEAARYGSPYPNLECCKDLRAAYNMELTEAVRAVIAAPTVAQETKVEAPAPADKVETQVAEAKASEGASADVEDLDNLLDDLANEDMSV